MLDNALIEVYILLQVLELGCGNSQLCDELYKDGITDLTSIDLSSVAVAKMQKRLLSKGLKGLCIVLF